VTEKVLAWLHAAAKAAAAADGSDIEGLDTLLDALVSGVEPHIVDYATDKHATHVARALLVVVTGRDVLTPPGKKQRQRQQQQQQQGGGGAEGEEGQAGGQQQQQQKVGACTAEWHSPHCCPNIAVSLSLVDSVHHAQPPAAVLLKP
jgi:hypothetical protein